MFYIFFRIILRTVIIGRCFDSRRPTGLNSRTRQLSFTFYARYSDNSFPFIAINWSNANLLIRRRNSGSLTRNFALLGRSLICCCLRIASDCKDPYKSMVAFGIAVQVTGQALFNIGVVTGLLPNKGLPLPFVSAGGSSLIEKRYETHGKTLLKVELQLPHSHLKRP